MPDIADASKVPKVGTFAPLVDPTFRTIWMASLLANLGQLIMGVGAAWQMTHLTTSASMVALVQTAMMLPLMLVGAPAGAIADMYDRRKIAMSGLAISCFFSATLTILTYNGLVTPWIMLLFCSLIGTGVALYGPAWQASIREQVDPKQLPAAVALGSLSNNFARSFGPALGGAVVLALGAEGAFAINATCYLPLFLAFMVWKRRHVPSRLPPERIDRAIIAGWRYALHSVAARTVLIRALTFGVSGASIGALAPLIAREQLNGDAGTYGLLLGAAGVGAVIGALMVSRVRRTMRAEKAVRLFAILAGISIVGTAFSEHLWLTCLLLIVSGGINVVTVALLNITIQMAVPRWVTARALSLFSMALTGGIAVGSAVWGSVAGAYGVEVALAASGGTLMLTPLFGMLFPLRESSVDALELVEVAREPDVGMALTMRSGPVVIELDYDIDLDQAREFYDAMLKVQRSCLRNGGFNWSLCRDIADPTLWTERYLCPTWGDYLRMRSRFTQEDVELRNIALAFSRIDGGTKVRRKLERPFGSVRWKVDSPDPKQDAIDYTTP
jgi:MFS family permease